MNDQLFDAPAAKTKKPRKEKPPLNAAGVTLEAGLEALGATIVDVTPKEDAEPAPLNALAIVQQNPLAILSDRKKFDEFYSAIEKEVEAFVPDVSTKGGRDAIKALAYKVVRTKTAIDGAGKTLNESARAQINVVDESRRLIRERLDALRDRTRAPLDEWEKVDDARKARCEATLAALRAAPVVRLGETAESVRQRITDLAAISITLGEFDGPEYIQAENMRASAVAGLAAAALQLDRAEAEAAELAELRAAAVERQRVEDERMAAQALAAAEEARAKREVEAETKRQAEKAAEIEAVAARAKKEAEDAASARLLEEQKRIREENAAALARQQNEEAARVKAAKKVADDQIFEANRQRQEAEDAAAALKAQRERDDRRAQQAVDEQRQRDEDQAHKSEVLRLAKEALLLHGFGFEPNQNTEDYAKAQEVARKIVLAIKAGMVPNVTLRF